MGYQPPNFNLTCNIQSYTTGVTRLSSVCNLAYGRRTSVTSTGGTGESGVICHTMFLLLPARTDIRPPTYTETLPVLQPAYVDQVEVPAGSGRIYAVLSVDDSGRGFTNEHRVATIFMIATPIPMP